MKKFYQDSTTVDDFDETRIPIFLSSEESIFGSFANWQACLWLCLSSAPSTPLLFPPSAS